MAQSLSCCFLQHRGRGGGGERRREGRRGRKRERRKRERRKRERREVGIEREGSETDEV